VASKIGAPAHWVVVEQEETLCRHKEHFWDLPFILLIIYVLFFFFCSCEDMACPAGSGVSSNWTARIQSKCTNTIEQREHKSTNNI